MTGKNEAVDTERCLGFFTMATPSGVWVHVTARNGVTSIELDTLMGLIDDSTKRMIENHGWAPIHEGRKDFYPDMPSGKQPAEARVGQPAPERQPVAPPPSNGGGTDQQHWDTRQSPCAVSRLLITGTKERPKVQMWSPNTALKYAAFEPTSTMVVNLLTGRYDVEQSLLQNLYDVGEEIPLRNPWLVHWTESPKNPKWKDIVTIDVATLVEKQPELPNLENDPVDADAIPF